MRLINKVSLGIAAAATIFIVGCSATQTQLQSEESLGLRKTDLYSEDTTVGDETKYDKTAAGSGKFIDRAFENAPPMISHDVEGMLPIKIGNNACLTCHAPDVAKAVKATPYPASHMTNYRPNTAIAADGRISKEGAAVNNTADLKTVGHKLGKLAGARYNCSQCHAPQSQSAALVENTFTPDFRAGDGSRRSNQVSNLMEGVDTLK